MGPLTREAVVKRYRKAKERRHSWEGHWQFSCWNEGDPNRERILAAQSGEPDFDICLRIARRAVTGVLNDPTGGATHYHSKDVLPAWRAGHAPSAVIGNHVFYNDVE